MKWLLPFSYGWATRAKTGLDKLSFFAVWLAPLFLLCGSVAGFSPGFFLQFVLAAWAQYALYEVGYLQNDFFTVRREKNPNHRLEEAVRKEIAKRFKAAVAVRFFAAALGCVLLSLTGMAEIRLVRFGAALVLQMGCFGLHNQIRSRWNILTYFLLCSVKYMVLPLLFCPTNALFAVLFSVLLSFPVPRTLEHASKEKYGLRLLKEPYHRFRAVYYALLSAAMLAGYLLGALPIYMPLLALWYFVYRAGILGVLDWAQRRRSEAAHKEKRPED